MFFSYQDNCLIGICWLESHEKKRNKTKKPNKTNPRDSRCSWITAAHLCSASPLRRHWSSPNPSVLSMQITCHRVDIHSPARLRLDTKLSCCLHQLWLRGLSGLCSGVVWAGRRYSQQSRQNMLAWIKYTVSVPFIARWFLYSQESALAVCTVWTWLIEAIETTWVMIRRRRNQQVCKPRMVLSRDITISEFLAR